MITVLMLKMDKVRGHHWRVARLPLASYFKICRNDENHFYIDPIQILRCHQNQCPEIRALQVKGKVMMNFLSFKFHISFHSFNAELKRLRQHKQQIQQQQPGLKEATWKI
jgi:hypothetical protein